MKSIGKILVISLLIIILLFGTMFVGVYKLIKLQKENEVKNEIQGGFPYNVEFEDYNIKINSANTYEDYILFDYLITKKDGSDIKEENIGITGSADFPDKTFFVSPVDILTADGKEIHIIQLGNIIARTNKIEPVKYIFNISTRKPDETYVQKEIKTKEKFNLTTENYQILNKNIKFNNIDFNIISLANFKFGSLLYLFTENINEKTCKEIMKNFSIKLKSKTFEQIYTLEEAGGFYDMPIKKFSKIDRKYNPNSQYDQFYISKMFYNINDVDRNNMQIYLVNNISNEEIQIF
ncbi:hypothetical protein [Clostridium tarantellae]|uniref:Uncharacterized protein n=1 Tax=Clostridium tarantellae TaxID=39493 RepID=A0A6I1MXH0_9CLOT|nr:hypothetical protein [Clostridium tarantellae]MPQ44849.1 hypothetical protein [Clostridium tarantellae]